jgi:hypothetical protein
MYQKESDEKFIKTLLVQGNRQLDQVRVLVSTAVATPITETIDVDANRAAAIADAKKNRAKMGVHEEDKEEQFRVGTGWPWQRTGGVKVPR